MKRILIVGLALGTACGGAIVLPSPTPTPSPTATVAATARVTASAAPTPITSSKGSITVTAPLSNTRITTPVTIKGDASVFEAALQWRIVDGGGKVLAQGGTTASAGAPGRGAFSVTASYPPPSADTIGVIQVYDTSPKDGTIDELVSVPVVIGR
ncbi:MAG TPA: Gmad2 immunoglobulin-like domain-containing protein [Candidatus Acidoferrales bacterium]|nr:Gmad2 immunoglobulin-like domain-containing protein [Candidatus Acidoferrales bacterium]